MLNGQNHRLDSIGLCVVDLGQAKRIPSGSAAPLHPVRLRALTVCILTDGRPRSQLDILLNWHQIYATRHCGWPLAGRT